MLSLKRIADTHTIHVYDNVDGWSVHLAIWRDDGKPIRWGWDTMQRVIQHYCPGLTMVEFFPEPSLVVNETNRRHFWSWDGNLPMHPQSRTCP